MYLYHFYFNIGCPITDMNIFFNYSKHLEENIACPINYFQYLIIYQWYAIILELFFFIVTSNTFFNMLPKNVKAYHSISSQMNWRRSKVLERLERQNCS